MGPKTEGRRVSTPSGKREKKLGKKRTVCGGKGNSPGTTRRKTKLGREKIPVKRPANVGEGSEKTVSEQSQRQRGIKEAGKGQAAIAR